MQTYLICNRGPTLHIELDLPRESERHTVIPRTLDYEKTRRSSKRGQGGLRHVRWDADVAGDAPMHAPELALDVGPHLS